MLHTSRRHELVCVRVCACLLVAMATRVEQDSKDSHTSSWLMHWRNQLWLGSNCNCNRLALELSLCVCVCVACHVCACVSSSSSSTSKPIFGFQRSSKTVSNEIYALRLKDGNENEHTHKDSVCVSHTWQLCVCPFPILTCRVIFGSSLPASASRVAYFMALPSLIRRQRQYFISNCWQSFLIKYDRLPDRLLLWGQLIELAKTPLLQLK